MKSDYCLISDKNILW